ncbi:histone-lysine N-methyltransferase SETMAR [Trichonephila clavipes]|nr:histone-lysine N-methyltransferase SETMAR [Trichonephila clavipes]
MTALDYICIVKIHQLGLGSNQRPWRTEEAIRANRRLKLKELHQIIPEVSMTTFYEVVTVKLGLWKLCAHWVPKMFNERTQKEKDWLCTRLPHTLCRKSHEMQNFDFSEKIMASVFWDRQGILLLEFMALGTTINAATYCQTLKRLRRAIQNKRRGMLTNGVRLLHDNARLTQRS